MNLIPCIGVYGALCRELGRPFSFPGGESYVAEAVDSRLLADALHWAATSPTAGNQTFNITNGHVFEWRDLWASFADMLEVEAGPDQRLSLAQWLPQEEATWRRIVVRHGLLPLSLREILGCRTSTPTMPSHTPAMAPHWRVGPIRSFSAPSSCARRGSDLHRYRADVRVLVCAAAGGARSALICTTTCIHEG